MLMTRDDVHSYLKSLNHDIFWVRPAQIPDQSKIPFYYGRLIFTDDYKFDKLFITHDRGFSQAAAHIKYFFAKDTSHFHPEFKRPYRAIIINNTEYTELSPTVFEQFALFKFAYLERNEWVKTTIVKEDCRYALSYYHTKPFKEYHM